jgi:hypothetical protein
MKTYLCRWPNGALSIVAVEDESQLATELAADAPCSPEEVDSPRGVVLELPRGFRAHFCLADNGAFEFTGWPQDAIPTLERLYPHLSAVGSQEFKTRKAFREAVERAVRRERGEQ